jgi:LL-diaminopimelate aminotransferase
MCPRSGLQGNEACPKLKAGYLFPEIARRVKAFCEANPEAAKRLIRCGIGDVTEPLPAAVVAAMHKAVDEMATRESFKGYGPEQGYEFLRRPSRRMTSATAASTWPTTKSSSATARSAIAGNILDILGDKNKIAISDPVYPGLCGHERHGRPHRPGERKPAPTPSSFICRATPSNGFIPEPPKKHVDVIYLCSRTTRPVPPPRARSSKPG